MHGTAQTITGGAPVGTARRSDDLGERATDLIRGAQRTLGGMTYTDTEDLAAAVRADGRDGLREVVDRQLTAVERGGFARAMDRAEGPAWAVSQIMGANADFLRNYQDMRDANTIGADKYFHCKANFEATQRGDWGERRAIFLSDSREWVDQNVGGDPASASAADQAANRLGRAQANADPSMMRREACHNLRPRGLDARY